MEQSLWGLETWDALLAGVQHQVALWLVPHLLVVVVVHAAAWVMWFVFLRARRLVRFVLVPLQFAAISYVAVQSTLWVRLAFIPDVLLHADERPGPHMPWEETCVVKDAYLLGSDRESPQAAWVFLRPSRNTALVKASDCETVRTEPEPVPKVPDKSVSVSFGRSWTLNGTEFLSYDGDWRGITRGEIVDESVFHMTGMRYAPDWQQALGYLTRNKPHERGFQYKLYENEPVQLQWNLSTGRGHYDLAAGRSVFSPQIRSDGSLIALVSSNTYWRDTVPDEVLVLSVSDGHEVLRAHVPALSRPLVRFVGSYFFAFTDFQDGEPSVRFFRIADR